MVIKEVLKEELDNSLKMEKLYQSQLKKLPKGSLIKKSIGGRLYYYLEFREGRKIVFKYVGKQDSGKIQNYQQAKETRLKYKKLLSDVKQQIRFLRRALNG